MCKKKTNKAKREKERIKVCADKIREATRHADNLIIKGKIEKIKGELELS